MSLIRAIKSANDEKHGSAGAEGVTFRMCIRVPVRQSEPFPVPQT